MDKYLIINADDFGMCGAHNAATVDLFKRGSITSATVMAPCPHAREAVDFAIRNPTLSVGVHLTTTSEWKDYRWGPITRHAASLTDGDGCFYRSSEEFAKSASIEDTRAELTAQIDLLCAMGLVPSHLDNHMGSLYGVANGDFRFLSLTIDLAARYGLPFRFPSRLSESSFKNGTMNIQAPPEKILESFDQFRDMAERRGVITPDSLVPGDWRGEQDKSYENFREYILELYRSFDNGVTETYIHPAIECEEIKAITPLWHRRVWEHRLFSDRKTSDHIKSLGIKLIGYRELAEIKGNKKR